MTARWSRSRVAGALVAGVSVPAPGTPFHAQGQAPAAPTTVGQQLTFRAGVRLAFEVVERGRRRRRPSLVPRRMRRRSPVAFRGSLHLGDALPAGAYVLQLTVTEDAASAARSTQWADFEVR